MADHKIINNYFNLIIKFLIKSIRTNSTNIHVYNIIHVHTMSCSNSIIVLYVPSLQLLMLLALTRQSCAG